MTLQKMGWPLALGSMVCLAACTGAGAAGDPSAPKAGAGSGAPTQLSSGSAPRNQCNAAASQHLVGQPWATSMLSEGLKASGADVVRMLRADSMITKEYQAGRLNIVLDATGQLVARVYCG